MAYELGTFPCMGLFEWNAGNLSDVWAGLLHLYLKNFTNLFVSCRTFQYSKYAATGNGSA